MPFTMPVTTMPTLEPAAVEAMFRGAATADLPLMCFSSQSRVIQIHSGPVANVQTMAPG